MYAEVIISCRSSAAAANPLPPTGRGCGGRSLTHSKLARPLVGFFLVECDCVRRLTRFRIGQPTERFRNMQKHDAFFGSACAICNFDAPIATLDVFLVLVHD